MKQTLLRHAYYLLTSLVVILSASGCWFSSDSPDNADQQDPTTVEMSTSALSTAPEDKPATIIFEEPELPLPEDGAI